MSKTLKKDKDKVKDIKGKQELLLVSLNEFYDNQYNKTALFDILNGKNKISLRIIDWFVTNYSKKNNIEYPLKKKMTSPKRTTLKKIHGKSSKKEESRCSGNTQHINVFLSYKNQLDGYSKKHFDPFCRRNRIEFSFNDDTKIVTTVGQLNFFRWAIQSNVLNYIIEKYKVIEEDMNFNTKKKKDDCDKKTVEKGSGSKKQRKKRAPLSVAASRNMNVNKNPITLKFE
tara:strand:+ start:339 stop:1022 length:684 start_codon:yes stop_codon:yes gene_type:complete